MLTSLTDGSLTKDSGMKKILMFLFLASCTTWGSHAAAGEVGAAYHQAMFTSTHPYLFVKCRDLTDEEMDDADNLPGGGYNDGSWTGQNPPTGEDEDGNPSYTLGIPDWDDFPDPPEPDFYAAQQVFEDDDGNIFILEDDGEITEIST